MEVSFALKTAIELAQNGNKSSFEFIYKETFSFVWYRANVIVNHNQDAAADIVQEAYIVCYQRLSCLENIDSFYSWMNSIIYHLGMQYFRKQKREFFLDDSEWEWTESEFLTDTHNSPELSVEEEATKEIVKELIQTLPEIQKITLLAYYYDGMKVEEIASSMDCPESTVKSRLNYARNSLKTAIETMEKAHGYRIHVISFPVMYFAFKELYLQTYISEECKLSIYQSLLSKLSSSSINHNAEMNDSSLDNINNLNSNLKYTASISASLDAARYATASLGISAVLTAALSGTPDIEPLTTFGILKVDFSTFIASLKTKFALASAATAIGNNDVMLIPEVNLASIPNYAMEAILTSNLSDYYSDITHPTTIVLDRISEFTLDSKEKP